MKSWNLQQLLPVMLPVVAVVGRVTEMVDVPEAEPRYFGVAVAFCQDRLQQHCNQKENQRKAKSSTLSSEHKSSSMYGSTGSPAKPLQAIAIRLCGWSGDETGRRWAPLVATLLQRVPWKREEASECALACWLTCGSSRSGQLAALAVRVYVPQGCLCLGNRHL